MGKRIDLLDDVTADALLSLARAKDSLLSGLLSECTVEPEDGSTVLWGHTVSDMQTDVEIVGDSIIGVLSYVSSGSLVTTWGEGHFLTLKFSDADESATFVKVGLQPSEGSGLVELDEDMNCVFKVTNSHSQILKVVSTDGTRSTVQNFDLSGLTMKPKD